MQPILRTERRGDGVNVVWEMAGEEMNSYFTFAELIDLRVNALDLLNTPSNYGIDEKTGKVGFVAFCHLSRRHE
ncbi:MAG TPA: hypothetical protein VKO45_07310 [Methanomicrobiales archaeon]|nr:hypothetical protein [Methanomicrobiales archaeon]